MARIGRRTGYVVVIMVAGAALSACVPSTPIGQGASRQNPPTTSPRTGSVVPQSPTSQSNPATSEQETRSPRSSAKPRTCTATMLTGTFAADHHPDGSFDTTPDGWEQGAVRLTNAGDTACVVNQGGDGFGDLTMTDQGVDLHENLHNDLSPGPSTFLLRPGEYALRDLRWRQGDHVGDEPFGCHGVDAPDQFEITLPGSRSELDNSEPGPVNVSVAHGQIPDCPTDFHSTAYYHA